MNPQALQLVQPSSLAVADPMADWQMIREQATILVKTGFLPQSIKTSEQAMAIVLLGRELGISTMVALNNINVIQGKPTVPPQLMLALINRTREMESFEIADDGKTCTVIMKRTGRKAHTETFSMEDAALMKTTEGFGDAKKNISLSEKYNWKQQPRTMRKWRCVSACARIVFPDIVLGLYTPEEMGADVNALGEVEESHEQLHEPPFQSIPVLTGPRTALPLADEIAENYPEMEIEQAKPEFINTATSNEIVALWPEFGVKLKGSQEVRELRTYLNERYKVGGPAQLSVQNGQALLKWLKEKQVKAQPKEKPAESEQLKLTPIQSLRATIELAEAAGVGRNKWMFYMVHEWDKGDIKDLTDEQADELDTFVRDQMAALEAE